MLIPGNALFANYSLNAPEAYTNIMAETNLPSCTTSPSPCLFQLKAKQFLGSTQFPFLQAILERVEVAQDDLSLRNIFVIKNNNSTLDDELVYRAFLKQEGYHTRLFSSETWEEWAEFKTPLGRVVSNFLEYAFQQEAQKATLVKRSGPLIEKANREAQQLIKDLQRPLIEKIEILRAANCYYKATNAELKGCEKPEMDNLITNALPRDDKTDTVRFKIKKDCCKVKISAGPVNVKLLGQNCTGDAQWLTAVPFYRYGGSNHPKDC